MSIKQETQLYPCPICIQWIYQPKLSVDYIISLKNAKIM